MNPVSFGISVVQHRQPVRQPAVAASFRHAEQPRFGADAAGISALVGIAVGCVAYSTGMFERLQAKGRDALRAHKIKNNNKKSAQA